MTESKITYDKNTGEARSFVGPDAVEVFRVATLASALGLLKVGITPTRGLTMKKALAMVTPYTGQTYKGKKDIERARADLKVWLQAMKSALPTEEV
jgi:hypothetical protein